MKQLLLALIAVMLLGGCGEKKYSTIIEASCSHGNTFSEWGVDAMGSVLDKELQCGCRIRGQVAMRESYIDLPPRIVRAVTNEPEFIFHIMR